MTDLNDDLTQLRDALPADPDHDGPIAVDSRALRAVLELDHFPQRHITVEWWDSGDWGEDQVRQALADYRGEATK